MKCFTTPENLCVLWPNKEREEGMKNGNLGGGWLKNERVIWLLTTFHGLSDSPMH